MVKFIYRFRSFIIVLCIVCFLPFSYCNTKAYAIGIDTPLEIAAGVLLSPEIAGALAVAGIGYTGYYLYSNYSDDVKDYLMTEILNYGIDKTISIYSDGSGHDYAGLTNDGLNFIQSKANDLKKGSSLPVSTGKTTSNTTPHSLDPFMSNGFYMQPYNLSVGVYTTFNVSYGDKLSFYYYDNFGAYKQSSSYTPTADCEISFQTYIDSSNRALLGLRASFDGGSTWRDVNTEVSTKTSGYMVFLGYNTVSNTVYVPSSSAISGDGIEGNASDSVQGTVAVPISGQYDSSKGETVYAPIDGSTTATVVNGLNVKTGTNTGTGSGTGTGTDASFWSELWDWLEKIYKGIIDIPAAIGALPGLIVTSIESALSYTFVPTATDFSDFNDSLQNDVKAKFPYSMDILKSLEVGADEFTDIHVNIWGHDCIIVSAQFVNSNISWVRIVTSCFWLFLLVVYVWRKINAVLGGGDINSTTVYAPTGGGSGPPSVM
ncbi:hypothetical protein [Clostridium sp. BL-8]|uniref:hypothetical protein n=1 Tax=Clostridium sp. BL-8 TaxID=349938 RepID=UPI00098C2BFF|nr:hypothetical protein [Clostridium sp. BL-8]OOM69523.1 hypothetical protein CLOBL_52210 [Clostridium sp. BL-8]